jgi:transcriptional regulator with XRE-family HTH domain
MKLAELIEETLMTYKELADEARLSAGTVSRMVNGHPVSRRSVKKVLLILGQKVGRKIDISEIEGLNLTNRPD